jgi:tRNA/tmRNA/rRNA uracil-C5-methylase (TrmA/RlmC/RlmD family)
MRGAISLLSLYDCMAWKGISLPSPRTSKRNGSQNITKTLNIEKDRKMYSLLSLSVNLSFFQVNDELLRQMRQWPLFYVQNYRQLL